MVVVDQFSKHVGCKHSDFYSTEEPLTALREAATKERMEETAKSAEQGRNKTSTPRNCRRQRSDAGACSDKESKCSIVPLNVHDLSLPHGWSSTSTVSSNFDATWSRSRRRAQQFMSRLKLRSS